MGHLINPLSNRLRISRVWSTHTTTFSKYSYFYLLHVGVELQFFANMLMKGKFNNIFITKGLILFKYVIIRHNQKTFLILFVYDTFFPNIIKSIQSSSKNLNILPKINNNIINNY